MITKKVKLVPLVTGHSSFNNGKAYYEQVIIYDGSYPSAMMHIDTLSTKEKDKIYEQLENGETVECFMIFSNHEVI